MVQIVHSLLLQVEGHIQHAEDEAEAEMSGDEEEVENLEVSGEGIDIAASMMPLNTSLDITPAMMQNDNSQVKAAVQPMVLLNKVRKGLAKLEEKLQQLQFTSVQTEVDLIKEIKLPAFRQKQAQSGHNGTKSSGKKSHSRLYTKKQQAKLEDWYQLSSRPEFAEIKAMYKVINSDIYCDREVQPEGITSRQIRIWFDNRRAKERTDYLKAKIKDMNTSGMESEALKKLKMDIINEAKSVLDARVTRLRETTQGSTIIIEEGRSVSGGAAEEAPKSSPGASGGQSSSKSSSVKKRLRIDYVASVRKAVKDARDEGRNEDEIRDIRNKAIDLARERLHIPTKSKGVVKSIGNDEVTHVKFKLLKMLEDDAPPEEVADIIELLGSLSIPKPILESTRITRQLKLAIKAYKDVKWLVKDIKSLIEKFSAANADPEPAADAPAAIKRSRVKFSIAQLKQLEKYFIANSHPGKKLLDRICTRLSTPPLQVRDAAPFLPKQVRCWFYKRRAANQPPQALVQDGSVPDGVPSDFSFTEEDVEIEEDDDTEEHSRAATPVSTPKNERDTKGGRIFSSSQLEIISAEYEKTYRPSAASVDELLKVLNVKECRDDERNPFGVTRRQVMTWFSNRRAKERTDFVKSKVKEAIDAGLGTDDVQKVREIADVEIKEKMETRNRSKGTAKRRRESTAPSTSKNQTSSPTTPKQSNDMSHASDTEEDQIMDKDSIEDSQTEEDDEEDDDDEDASVSENDSPSQKRLKLHE